MSYELLNVSYSYGEREVLKDISLSFKQGEIHAVVGQNGAGKTTLMRILAGYILPKKGQINFPLQSISMVHQHFMLVDEFTVAENLYLNQIDCLNFSKKADDIIKQAQKILDDLEWSLNFGTRVSHLSIGDRQRLEILKAMLKETSFIILDEPTAVLSELEVQSLFKNLRSLIKQGKGIILIAHKPKEVVQIADHISVLRDGFLIWTKQNKEITTNELVQAIIGKELTIEDNIRKISRDEDVLLEIEEGSTDHKINEIALRNISLTLKKGEIFGIGGIEGNGQKELAELILNFRKLNHGKRKESKSLVLTYLPQNPSIEALGLQMSLVENLLIDSHRLSFLKNGWIWNKCLKDWARKRLSDFNVKYEALDQPIKFLSGGNQQKLILSRLESLDSDIWVAMNPTRGLDVSATSFVHKKIKEYAEKGTSIVLISSDLEELNSLADRVVFMNNGELLKEFLS